MCDSITFSLYRHVVNVPTVAADVSTHALIIRSVLNNYCDWHVVPTSVVVHTQLRTIVLAKDPVEL